MPPSSARRRTGGDRFRPVRVSYGISSGLGGRDVRVESIQHVFAELEKIAATGEVGETYRYLDVRE